MSRSSHTYEPLRQYLPGLYPVGIILLLSPMVDVLTRVLPLRAWDVGWRFGALGMSFDSMVTALLGMGVLLTVAVTLNHNGARKALGFLALFGAFCTFVSLGLFALDYLQLRASVDARALRGFDLAALKALMEAALTMAALVFLGRRAVTAGVAPIQNRLVVKAEKEVLV